MSRWVRTGTALAVIVVLVAALAGIATMTAGVSRAFVICESPDGFKFKVQGSDCPAGTKIFVLGPPFGEEPPSPCANCITSPAYGTAAEPPCAPLAALVGRVGPAEAAERIRRGPLNAELDRVTSARRDIDSAAQDLDRIDRLGGRLVTPQDTEWPVTSFAAFAGVDVHRNPGGIAPLALWVTGEVAISDEGGASGASSHRKPSAQGSPQAADW